MISLQPVSGKKKRPVLGVRGNAIYFPLNISATQTHLRNTLKLPTSEAVHIVVRGLPSSKNSKKIIRETLVNVPNVLEWLHFLKAHNPAYKDVEIMDEAELRLALEDGLCLDVEEAEESAQQFREEDVGTVIKHLLRSTGGNDQVSLIPVDKSILPNRSNVEFYQQERITDLPVSYFNTPNLDVLCFPHLFPSGKYGLNDPSRKVKIGVAEAGKWYFRNKSSHFRKDFQFIFHWLNVKYEQIISSAMFAQLHTRNLAGLTAGRICEMVAEKSPDLEQNIRSVLGNIPGTPQWWGHFQNEIEATVREHGPPTFFMTLGVNEYTNPFFKEALKRFNPEWTDSDVVDVDELTARDPGAVAIISNHYFELLFHKFICVDEGPLGTVTHYTFRKEYQVDKNLSFHLLQMFLCV